MIPQKLWLLVTFHTTAGAIAMEKRCKAEGIPGRLIPLPRRISADCGMAWRAEPDCQERLKQVTADLDIDQFYLMEC